MAIEKELRDQLLAARDPKDIFKMESSICTNAVQIIWRSKAAPRRKLGSSTGGIV